MVAALAQLHDDVEQLAAVRAAAERRDVLLQQLLVPRLLHLAHADLEDGLLLWRQTLLDVALDAPQQERPQHLHARLWWPQRARQHGGALAAGEPRGARLMQLLHDLCLVAARVAAEPLVEALGAGEDLGQEEVEERPQLVQVVLQRRAGDEEAVGGAEHAHGAREDGVLVLDAVRLVDDDVAPVHLLEEVLLLDDHLVRRDDRVELAGLQEVRLLVLALLRVAVELDGPQRGAPPPELVHPVVQRRLGHDHHVRPADAAELEQVAQQRDRLQRLAQPLHTRAALGGRSTRRQRH